MAFVYAYSKRTGKKLANQVPEEWLDHPVLGKGLSRTPRQKAAETAVRTAPAKSTTTEPPAAGDKKE